MDDEYKKILIVDDDPELRTLIQLALKKEYLITLAENGREAIEQVGTFGPDLILLDIDMPELDGLNTCRMIREDPAHRYIKIIFLSGRVTLQDRLDGYEAGGDDYICKPFDKGELLAKIRIMMRLKYEEQLSSVKSTFLSLIAHETRTPLNGILGFATLLSDTGSTKQKEMAEMILASGNQLFDFIKKATFICELQGGMQPNLRPEYIDKIISSAINHQDLTTKEISIKLDVDYFQPVEVDNKLIWQLFDYVLGNAVKSSPAKGEVLITVKPAAESGCIIDIADQGEGIPERMRSEGPS